MAINKKQLCFGVAAFWLIATQFSVMHASYTKSNVFRSSSNIGCETPPEQMISAPSYVSSGNATMPWKVQPAPALRNNIPPRAPWFMPPKDSPRVFILESTFDHANLLYGFKYSETQSSGESKLTSAMIKDICDRERQCPQRTRACNKNTELNKCVSCSASDGVWYSIVSQAGSALGHMSEYNENDTNNNTMVALPSTTLFRQIDFVVPAVGQDDKLKAFANRLGKTIKRFRGETFNGHANQNVTIRLIVTETDSENAPSTLSRSDLAKRAALDEPEMVILHKVAPPTSQEKFNKAQVVNALFTNACNADDCMVIALDVDMDCSASFLYNSMSFVESGSSVYFPVVWSTYNPKTFNLVEGLYRKKDNNFRFGRTSNHRGTWRPRGYGMYAMSGTDAHQFKLDESFVGWGGEDVNFFGRVRERRHIVRMQDKSITHLWHLKDCETESFVDDAQYRSCIGSASTTEGSAMGLYLALQKQKGIAKRQVQTSNVPDTKVRTESSILITVTSSRKEFGDRVSAISQTWAKNLPANVMIRYFVGTDPDKPDSGSPSDVKALAQSAGIKDTSLIIVTAPADNEYPPVRKNTAMLKTANMLVTASAGMEYPIGWVMKSDDDTYVNVEELKKLVKDRDPSKPLQLGKRGVGRKDDKEGLEASGLTAPFCMGGPGYIFSQAALAAVVPKFDECSKEFNASKWRSKVWHSDTVIGICTIRTTGGQGCWTNAEKEDTKWKARFVHVYESVQMTALLEKSQKYGVDFVSVHPCKKSEEMVALHNIVHPNEKVKGDAEAATRRHI